MPFVRFFEVLERFTQGQSKGVEFEFSVNSSSVKIESGEDYSHASKNLIG